MYDSLISRLHALRYRIIFDIDNVNFGISRDLMISVTKSRMILFLEEEKKSFAQKDRPTEIGNPNFSVRYMGKEGIYLPIYQLLIVL